MADTVDPKLIDRRTAERYLRSGLLDEKNYERYLKSLPDVADKAEPVTTAMSEDEGGDTEPEQTASQTPTA